MALARRDGWSWATIARLLGRSRQYVHQRFRTVLPTLPPDPLAAHHRWELDVARLQAAIADPARRRSRARADGEHAGHGNGDEADEEEVVAW